MVARFVVFEGGEGCGKSTQARLLADALGAILTHEPGGTRIGEQIRGLLLDHRAVDLDPGAEALMMAADRAQHVAEVIVPALEQGRHVVCDRYIGSSVAYQGFGRGMDIDEIVELSRWATGGLVPDLVILLDIPPEAARRRLERSLDRFEREGLEFHHRVREGFLAQAASEPDRWCVIDGDTPVTEVSSRVRTVVAERLQLSM